jgi:hypothetical protein
MRRLLLLTPTAFESVTGTKSSHGAMMFAVRLGHHWTAAKVKIRAARIATWPTAGLWGERENLFGGAKAWVVGEAGCLGARKSGLFQSGWPSAAICSDWGRDGDPLDLSNRHRPHGQETKHNADAARDAAIAALPASDTPRADAEQLGNAMLRDAKRAEYLAELARGHDARMLPGLSVPSWLDCMNGHHAPVAADGILVNSKRGVQS